MNYLINFISRVFSLDLILDFFYGPVIDEASYDDGEVVWHQFGDNE